MSIGVYKLRLKASYDVPVVFEMARFRALLRKERERRVGGREKLAAKAGVNKTTIQNIESGPDMPGIDTVAKLIEAMPDFSLSAFFLQLETGAKPAEIGPHGGKIARVEAETPAIVDVILHEVGTAILVRAAHQHASTPTNRPVNRPRPRKSKSR